MATEADILAVLTGRKIFDSAAKLWRVYDSGGVELANPGGVLWRGVHGALLWNVNGQPEGTWFRRRMLLRRGR